MHLWIILYPLSTTILGSKEKAIYFQRICDSVRDPSTCYLRCNVFATSKRHDLIWNLRCSQRRLRRRKSVKLWHLLLWMSQTWTTIIQNVPKLFTELLCQRTDQRTLLWWRWDTEYNFIRWINICFIFPSFFLFPKCTKSSGPIIEFGSFQVLDLRVKRWDLQISQPRFFICWTVSLFIHFHLVFL